MYREKINGFIRVISGTEDSDCFKIMEELINIASGYISRVNVLEIGLSMGRYDKESTEYTKYMEKFDKMKNDAHNILISNIKVINRLCKKNNLPLIYEGNEERKIEVSEFAQKVVDELFSTSRL